VSDTSSANGVSIARLACALLVAGFLQLAPSAVMAQQLSSDELLSRAIDSYASALEIEDRDRRLQTFHRAEMLFGRVVASGGESPELYTNLGNAALQAERLGPAVLAYRRALLFDPDHARALQNLAHARGLQPDWVPRPEQAGVLDSFFFWHRTIPRADRAFAAAVCFAAAALALAIGIRFGQSGWRNAAWLPGLAWVALASSVWLDPGSGSGDDAVITVPEVVARSADSALSPAAFPQPLPGGVEVSVLERRSPWLRVRMAGGRDAWISESSVTSVARAD
jgi:tetratricopeptide (TPR) repeat protein